MDYLNKAQKSCPELTIIPKLIPLYRKLNDLVQKMWDLHGGFMPAPSKMQEHPYREQLAAILRQMGMCCEDILRKF